MALSIFALQTAANDPSYPVSRLLRDAIVTTSKLPVSGMIEYFKHERDGYEKAEIPEYRWIQGNPVAQVAFGRWIPLGLEGFEQGLFTKRPLVNSVSEIEEVIARTASPVMIMPYPEKIIAMFRHQDSDLFNAGIECGVNQFKNVLEQVRNRILDFTISLEKEGIVGPDMPIEVVKREMRFSNEDAKEPTTVFNIENFQGAAGTVIGSHVHIGDYIGIHNVLKDAGVPQNERNELEIIIDEAKGLPPVQRKSLGGKATEWLGRNKQFLLTAGVEVTKVLHDLGIL